LQDRSDFTIDKLIEAAYDPTLTAFEDLIPGLLLITAVDSQGELQASIQTRTLEYIDLLRNWDYNFSIDSTATTLAVYWGQALMAEVATEASRANINIYEYMANNADQGQKLSSLRSAAEQLEADFGDWRVPWGDVNRYQRINGDIVQKFDDEAKSLPVAFGSARWGSLASFGSRTYPGTKKMYGTSGNSFVAAVEFGDKVTAKAITVGGLHNDPNSPHFDDQAEMYTQGEFRDVLFYREDIEANLEKEYSPGN